MKLIELEKLPPELYLKLKEKSQAKLEKIWEYYIKLEDKKVVRFDLNKAR